MTKQTLIETITRQGKVSEYQAELVIAVYQKAKVLKYNVHDGFNISHGGLFDRETIQHCLMSNFPGMRVIP